ncbi:MAG: T9SS type A sorting domain-containing protein, partial [Bacteroidales bacterium]|nr:T9SS type A sorting domain-containing protein [Bacteroidales bacterium]MEE1204127.1 T9SS type A sorting domain-containing protein [Bacteroidales bacterium]
ADKIIRIESNASELKEAQLIDANGRVLKAWDNLPNEIDISQYPTGTYFLNVSVNGTRISRKVNFN